MIDLKRTDRVWWAPIDSIPGDESCWHALAEDPRYAARSARGWAVCHWVGKVRFEGRILPPILCPRCWRTLRDTSPEADHRLVTPEQWRIARARNEGVSDANR